MCNFSFGMAVGTVLGASIIIAVHPMNKRAMRKAYHKAEKMMNRVNNTIHNLA